MSAGYLGDILRDPNLDTRYDLAFMLDLCWIEGLLGFEHLDLSFLFFLFFFFWILDCTS